MVRSDKWQWCDDRTMGLAYASAIAAGLQRAVDCQGVYEAQEYTWQSLKAGFRPGMGQHLPDRLFWARDESDIGNNKDDAKGGD